MSPSEAQGPLQTADRVLQILSLFNLLSPELTVTQAARTLGINPTIASRLLATLEIRGFVIRDPETGRFRLGVRNLDLGMLYLQTHPLVTVAAPYLEMVVERNGPGVQANLFVFEGGQALRLTSYPTRPSFALRVPAHCTGAGKVLLAALTEEELDRVVEEHGLPARTVHTITDLTTLREHLRGVRERGYATDAQENGLGRFCCAAPVRDQHGRTVGAISIGCSDAMVAEHGARLMEAIMETANRVSECLGSGFLPAPTAPQAPASSARSVGRRQSAADPKDSRPHPKRRTAAPVGTGDNQS